MTEVREETIILEADSTETVNDVVNRAVIEFGREHPGWFAIPQEFTCINERVGELRVHVHEIPTGAPK